MLDIYNSHLGLFIILCLRQHVNVTKQWTMELISNSYTRDLQLYLEVKFILLQ